MDIERVLPPNTNARRRTHIVERNLLRNSLSWRLRQNLSVSSRLEYGHDTDQFFPSRDSRSSWQDDHRTINPDAQLYHSKRSKTFHGHGVSLFPQIENSISVSVEDNQSDLKMGKTEQTNRTKSVLFNTQIDEVYFNSNLTDDTARKLVSVSRRGRMFVPIDKYASRTQSNHRSRHQYIRDSDCTTIMLSMDISAEQAYTDEDKLKGHRKHVNWKSEDDDDQSESAEEEESNEQPFVPRPVRSAPNDYFFFRKPKYTSGKSQVQHIGLKWKVAKDNEDRNRISSSGQGRISKNIRPVTVGLTEQGTSVSRTQGGIPPTTDLDFNKDWKRIMDKVKRPERRKDFHRNVRQVTWCS